MSRYASLPGDCGMLAVTSDLGIADTGGLNNCDFRRQCPPLTGSIADGLHEIIAMPHKMFPNSYSNRWLVKHVSQVAYNMGSRPRMYRARPFRHMVSQTREKTIRSIARSYLPRRSQGSQMGHARRNLRLHQQRRSHHYSNGWIIQQCGHSDIFRPDGFTCCSADTPGPLYSASTCNELVHASST